MKLKVIEYIEKEDAYRCLDEENKRHLVDFHVSGSPEIKKYLERKNLVGKTVTCDYLQPWLELSSDVLSVE